MAISTAIKGFRMATFGGVNVTFLRGKKALWRLEKSKAGDKNWASSVGQIAKERGVSYAYAKGRVVDQSFDNVLSGRKSPTIGMVLRRGRKGNKIIINAPMAKNLGGGTFRETVVHEKFHTLPIVGRSELLAHFAGAYSGRKGQKSVKRGLSRSLEFARHNKKQATKELRKPAAIAGAVGAASAGAAIAKGRGRKKGQKGKVIYRRIRGKIVPIKVKK